MITTAFADRRYAVFSSVLAANKRGAGRVVVREANDGCERSANKLRIFIVDDLAKFRASFRFRLRQVYDHDVDDAATAQDALDRLLDDDAIFDLIFIDVQMPKKDGIALYKELRAAGIETPVVLMSALEQNRSRVEALKVPFFDKALGDSLERILEMHSRSRTQ